MKRLIIIASMLLLGVGFAVEEAAANKPTKKQFEDMTPEEQKAHIAKREARRAAKAAAEGGYVEKENDGRLLYVLNAQSLVSSVPIEETIRDIESTIHLKGCMEKCEGTDVLSMAQACIRDRRAGMVVVLVEDANLPSMLIAPESRWGAINVASLAKDSPRQDVLDARVKKEIWRTTAYVTGAANSMFQPCLMSTILYPRELDTFKDTIPSPEPFNKMISGARKFGMKPIEIVTYRTACREGWAPSPTNDVQRAIWEEVSADKERGPTNTRPIKFRGRRPPRP